MELVGSLEGMFPWQTAYCCPLLSDVMSPDGTIPSLDAMLVDMGLPEIPLAPESISLSLPPSVTVPQCQSLTTIPEVTLAIQAPASIQNPVAKNTNSKPGSVRTGTRGIETSAAPTSLPMSSAPDTPPVGKPKRSRGRGRPAKSKSSPPKKKKKNSAGLKVAVPKSKENRVPTEAEHIIRERQRRDDMAAKYSILESLLPSAPKRERAVVVEDAISFLGALQQKKDQLLNRRDDLKLMASCNQFPWSNCKKPRFFAPREPLGDIFHPSERIVTRPRSEPGGDCKSESPLSASSDGVVVRADPAIVTSSSPSSAAGSISTINVLVGEQEIVMEMVWNKPHRNSQSALLQAVQSLGFDVTQCSIFKEWSGYMQCVVTCSKSEVLSQRISEIQSSSTLIIAALRNMLTQS